MSHEFAAPKLTDLMTRYMARQAAAHAVGLAAVEGGDVLPYDAGPVHAVDPKLAWDAGCAALAAMSVPLPTRGLAVPPQWASLVAGHEPVMAIALCVGNYPQMMRDFHALLASAKVTELRPQSAPTPPANSSSDALLKWAHSADSDAHKLLAAGVLRLAKRYTEAETLLAGVETELAARDNERAALAWHVGDAEKALSQWKQQPDSAPALFNRGMAELFLGRPEAARASLQAAVTQIPERSAWHHLARLYLTLAQQG